MKEILMISFLLLSVNYNLLSQNIPYGFNDKNGRYANTGDANIYYEVYGEGKPVVLLHGGFAYIDQYKGYIPILSEKYKIIAIAHRGYGKSEIGTKEFSYRLLAEDLKTILQKESQEKAILIGFSSGAWLSYFMAIEYPEIIDKVVAMGGDLELAVKNKNTDNNEDANKPSDAELDYLSGMFEQFRPDFKKIIPQPERWDEFIENIALLWSESCIGRLDDLEKIECPVLLLFGAQDPYCRPEHIAEIYEHIPNAQMKVVPNAGHLDVSPLNTALLDKYILKFIE